MMSCHDVSVYVSMIRSCEAFSSVEGLLCTPQEGAQDTLLDLEATALGSAALDLRAVTPLAAAAAADGDEALCAVARMLLPLEAARARIAHAQSVAFSEPDATLSAALATDRLPLVAEPGSLPPLLALLRSLLQDHVWPEPEPEAEAAAEPGQEDPPPSPSPEPQSSALLLRTHLLVSALQLTRLNLTLLAKSASRNAADAKALPALGELLSSLISRPAEPPYRCPAPGAPGEDEQARTLGGDKAPASVGSAAASAYGAGVRLFLNSPQERLKAAVTFVGLVSGGTATPAQVRSSVTMPMMMLDHLPATCARQPERAATCHWPS